MEELSSGAVSGSAVSVDYSALLQDIQTEIQVLELETERTNELLDKLVTSFELVNIFFYILFACIVCFFGYKVISWFF